MGLGGPERRRGPFQRGWPTAGDRLALLCGCRAWRVFQVSGQGAGRWGCSPLEGVRAGGSLQG